MWPKNTWRWPRLLYLKGHLNKQIKTSSIEEWTRPKAFEEEPCFCKHKLNIEIESEVTLLNLSGFFVRLALLLFVLSCGSWESSSDDTFTHLGAFHHPNGVTTPIVFNHISFLQLFIFFFHVHFISKSLNMSLVVPIDRIPLIVVSFGCLLFSLVLIG